MNKWLALAAFILLCIGVAVLAGYATTQSVTTWYPTLNKPDWTPPSWLFGPVWTVLYVMMALAAWLIWQHKPVARTAMTLFFIQLILNLLWSFAFFGARSPFLGLINILVLWLAIAATIVAFNRSSRSAAMLLIPYFCWVSFATALNFTIWQLN